MKEKISVVVPIYNVENYLEKCLDCLLNQTLKDIRIICVNDGATDNSPEILKKYAEKDSRIEVVEKKNGGLSSARNAGLEKVKTEFVMFCDSDDYFSPKMCEKLLASIEKEKTDIAACGTEIVYLAHDEMRESDRKYYRLEFHGKNYIDDEIMLKTDVSVWNKVFRTKTIKENNIEFPEGLNNEDFYFFNAYMSVSSTISFVNQKLYNYVRRENSIMSANFQKDTLSLDHLLVAEKLFDFYRKTGFLKVHTDLFWQQWVDSFWFSLEHSSKNHHKEIRLHAKEFALKHLKNYPPESDSVSYDVKYIIANSPLSYIRRKGRQVLASAYKKINISYRQQSFINSNIEDLQRKIDDLSDRLDTLKEKND